MKIRICVEARYIPDGTRVRKAKGEAEYTLRRQLNVVLSDGKKLELCQGSLLLVPPNNGTLYAVTPETQLAVPFDDADEAGQFIDSLKYCT